MAFCKFWLWGLTWVWSLTESLVQPSKQWDMQKKEGETTVHFADTLRRELKSCYENLHPTVIGVISKEASNLSGWLALPGSGSANQGTGWVTIAVFWIALQAACCLLLRFFLATKQWWSPSLQPWTSCGHESMTDVASDITAMIQVNRKFATSSRQIILINIGHTK